MGSSPEPDAPPAAFLIVDSDGRTASRLSEAFARHRRHTLRWVRSPPEARDVLATEAVDLVFVASPGPGGPLPLVDDRGGVGLVVLCSDVEGPEAQAARRAGSLDVLSDDPAVIDALPYLAETLLRAWRQAQRMRDVEDQLRHADRLAGVGRIAATVAHEIATPLNVARMHAQLLGLSDGAADDVSGGDRRDHGAGGSGRWPDAPDARLRPAQSQASNRSSSCAGSWSARSRCSRPRPARRWSTSRSRPSRRSGSRGTKSSCSRSCSTSPPTRCPRCPTAAGCAWWWRRARGEARVALSDTGRGVAPGLLSEVFRPFFTTKPAGRGDGARVGGRADDRDGPRRHRRGRVDVGRRDVR